MSEKENSFIDEGIDEESKSYENSVFKGNVDDFFDVIFTENLYYKLKDEEFKSLLSKNYKNIIQISKERDKFLDTFDQAKQKLSQAHQKILLLFDKKALESKSPEKEIENEDESEDSENMSENSDLEEKIDDYIEKKNYKKRENEDYSNENESYSMNFLENTYK